jgi:hypothetical protein
MEMKFKWIVVAVAALGIIAADPALARAKHQAYRHCAPQPRDTSWSGWLFNPAPQPNGCAPPVYAYGRYIGQNSDPTSGSSLCAIRPPAIRANSCAS